MNRTQPSPLQAPPQAILLDIMDTVVVDPFFDDDLGAHFGLDRQTLFSRMTPDIWPAFERNELTAEVYYSRFFKDGSGVDGPALEAWMTERYRWVDGMKDLLSELKSLNIGVFALSNYPVWWQHIEDRLGLGRYLEWRFVSCMTGVRKPDPAAYLGPASSLSLPPGACLFIDDRLSNCDAAQAVGMPAHHFQTTAQLRADLRRLGLELAQH
ncbi:MAG: HAD-IA family hydrolase [Myxococcales bacterium]|nr:HAD-IA family hydrolase [Myxococcales bacterium]